MDKSSKSDEFHLIRYKKHNITFAEMVIVFTFASVIGYFVETGYVYLVVGNIVKRGMLLGPYCPIYGFGALCLYYCFYDVKTTKANIPLIFIVASLMLGSFELLCGLGFKYILNIEMWNYSGKFLNILNYTTVPILIGWGILGTMYVFWLHPILLKLVRWFPRHVMNKLAVILVGIFIIDFLISTRRIISKPEILDNLVNPQNVVSLNIF